MEKIETIKWVENNIARLKVYPLGDIVKLYVAKFLA